MLRRSFSAARHGFMQGQEEKMTKKNRILAFLGTAALMAVSMMLIGCNAWWTSQGSSQWLYVVDGTNGVLVFSASANGSTNAAPSSTITGDDFTDAHHVAFDSTGKIYVTDFTPSIKVFTTTIGNPGIYATITAGNAIMNSPEGIALDASGKIYVADANLNTVTVYPANTQGGNITGVPVATISGAGSLLSCPHGVALDASGKIYVANTCTNESVTVYAANPQGSNFTLLATISGAASGLSNPHGIALDASGKIYVANHDNPNNLPPTVTVYAANPQGSNFTLLATISGAASGLSNPNGIALDTDGNIFVSNHGNNSVTVYAANPQGSNFTLLGTISGNLTGFSDLHGLAVH